MGLCGRKQDGSRPPGSRPVPRRHEHPRHAIAARARHPKAPSHPETRRPPYRYAVVPAQSLQRTVQIRTPIGFGTAFTIDARGRQWLVTAHHVVAGFEDDQLAIHSAGPVDVTLTSIPQTSGADIAVFELSRDITPENMPLNPTAGSVSSPKTCTSSATPTGSG